MKIVCVGSIWGGGQGRGGKEEEGPITPPFVCRFVPWKAAGWRDGSQRRKRKESVDGPTHMYMPYAARLCF